MPVKLGKPGSTPYHHAASVMGSDTVSSFNLELRPVSPMLPAPDFSYPSKKGKGRAPKEDKGHRAPKEDKGHRAPKEDKNHDAPPPATEIFVQEEVFVHEEITNPSPPPHPDSLIREEVFNALEYCGFLDIRLAALYRWAVGVVWSMQMFRQRWVLVPFIRQGFSPFSFD